MIASKAIANFWKLFEQSSRALAKCTTADDPVYGELLEQLHKVNTGLFIEFSTPPGTCELIITAEGDVSLFALVDSVISAAPQVKGWSFLALKPKLGFPEAVEWQGCVVKIAEVVFEPLSKEGADDFGLRFLVPGVSERDLGKAHNALLRALDHGLGEREFAGAVKHTEVAMLKNPTNNHIPLIDLENFIHARSNGCMDLKWINSTHTYEGFPLFLRRPTTVDTPTNRRRYQLLTIITHEFARRCPDGRPTPDYNETLFDFDQEMIHLFNLQGLGIPVLVETFSGNRNYYFYTSKGAGVEAIIQPFSRRFPQEKLTWETRPDTNWSFLDKYAKEFF